MVVAQAESAMVVAQAESAMVSRTQRISIRLSYGTQSGPAMERCH
jgi:hypothetical protein